MTAISRGENSKSNRNSPFWPTADGAIPNAVKLNPSDPLSQNNLGFALLNVGRPGEALAPLLRAAGLDPAYPDPHYNLSQAYVGVGEPAEAGRQLVEALRLRPEWPPAMRDLAWLLATEPGLGEPGDAVRVAERAAELTGRADPTMLDALAAAYAAAQRFEEAVSTAEAAIALAAPTAPDLAAQIEARLGQYRAGRSLLP